LAHGRLDADAVNGVLIAAGQRVGSKRKELVGGLSEREVEVLRLVTRSLSIKGIAGQLSVAPKRWTIISNTFMPRSA